MNTEKVKNIVPRFGELATLNTRSMLYKQHPYKQQLVIAVKFYILLLKSKNKQHTKKD